MAGRRFLHSVLVGAIAGLGAVMFFYLLQLGLHVFLGDMAHFYPAEAGGERALFAHGDAAPRMWAIPLVVVLGGLLSGLLVYTLAPEAEGHGTDTVIQAFHMFSGRIRGRVSLVKIVASALTMGSGGSGGREGPIALIAAGFGSFLAGLLKLSDRDRRILVAVGMGAGIGAIFRAPLAGALFSAEVLYREEEIEHEALIPAIVASIIGYSVFASFFGWGALFTTPSFTFSDPLELLPYAGLGIICAGFGFAYIKSFYGIRDLFARFRIPDHVKPALGGVVAGAIGLALPQTLALGYGVVQKALDGNLPAGLLLAIATGKIVTTSFSIGSGGSGGVFGPAMVIGGCVGGAIGQWAHALWPTVITQPEAFIVVGMVGFFSGAASTPISTIIMVSEMTGNYNLLVPSMLVCAISFLILRKYSIYERQVPNRLSSPAHLGEMAVDVLQGLPIKNWVNRNVVTVPKDAPLKQAVKLIRETHHARLPVLDEDQRPVGVISAKDALDHLVDCSVPEKATTAEAMRADVPRIEESSDLLSALYRIDSQRGSIVVVTGKGGRLVGILSRNDILHAYREASRRTLPAVRRAESGAVHLPADIVVSEAMSLDFPSVPPDLPLDELKHLFEATHHHGFPVVEPPDRLFGVVTWRDLERAETEMPSPRLVRDIATTEVITCYPHETLTDAMRKFAERDVGRLIVVDPADSRRIVGLLRRGDVISAYARVATEMPMHESSTPPHLLDTPGARFLDLLITERSPWLGKKIRDLRLPQEALIVCVQRGPQLLIPHGSTTIQKDDHVVLLAQGQVREQIRREWEASG